MPRQVNSSSIWVFLAAGCKLGREKLTLNLLQVTGKVFKDFWKEGSQQWVTWADSLLLN